VLADPAISREHFDVVTDEPSKVIGHVTLPGSTERTMLAAAWDAALMKLIGDARLSAADRLSAVGARVDIAKLDAPKGAALPEPLIAIVRDQVRRGDKETRDPYAREVVINQAADILAEAGLFDESDALLTAELARSHTPYYHMLGLAANARKRGDKATAGFLDREGVCRGERAGDAAAVGRRLRQHADRFDARRYGNDRARGDPGDRRARAGSRYVLRSQPPVAGKNGEEARRVEQGQRARRRAPPHPHRAARRLHQASCR
jgi:hypothetical protein